MNFHTDDKTFSSLLLIGGYDCTEQIPDLNVFGGARITGNLCVAGNVTILGNLDVGGNIYCADPGNCVPIIGSAFKYQLHHSMVTADGGSRSNDFFPAPPNGQDWSGDFPSTYMHMFTGPVGLSTSYHAIAHVASTNAQYGCTVAEVDPSDLNANPVTTAAVIGTLSPIASPSSTVNYNFIVGNLVPTITPSIWFYYQGNASVTSEMYDVHITEN